MAGVDDSLLPGKYIVAGVDDALLPGMPCVLFTRGSINTTLTGSGHALDHSLRYLFIAFVNLMELAIVMKHLSIPTTYTFL